MSATASKMLAKFGQPAILRQYTAGGGDYDPTTGVANPVIDIALDSVRNILILDTAGKQINARAGVLLEKGTVIQDTDRWCYMDAKGNAPTNSDHLIVEGIDYSIIDWQRMSPAGIPMYYLMALRA